MLSLWCSLISSTLSWKFYHIGLSKLWPLSSQFSNTIRLYCVPPPPSVAGNCLQTVNGDNCRSHFPCFSSIRDHSPTLPLVHCLKTVISYNWPSFLIVYRKKEIPKGFRDRSGRHKPVYLNIVPLLPWQLLCQHYVISYSSNDFFLTKIMKTNISPFNK